MYARMLGCLNQCRDRFGADSGEAAGGHPANRTVGVYDTERGNQFGDRPVRMFWRHAAAAAEGRGGSATNKLVVPSVFVLERSDECTDAGVRNAEPEALGGLHLDRVVFVVERLDECRHGRFRAS